MNYAFVFTNYNNSQYTIDAVHSILDCDWEFTPDIVVVDNDSSEREKERLKLLCQYKSIYVLFNDSNVGYFSGLNDGLSFLPRDPVTYSAVVIGNNDLLFEKEFPEQLKLIANSLSKYPVVAPDIVTLDGIHQNPHVSEEPSYIRERLWDLYYCNYWLATAMGWLASVSRYFTERKDYRAWDASGEILQGYGACYILGPIFFRRLGRLYTPTMLMGEEYFLQYQLERIGFKTFYDPRIQVSHIDHASTGLVSNRKIWGFGKIAHKQYRTLKRSDGSIEV